MINKPIEIVELEDDIVIDTNKPISKKELTAKLNVNKNYLARFINRFKADFKRTGYKPRQKTLTPQQVKLFVSRFF